jgi:acetylcholinesterase/carboxylesterase 2
MATDFVFTCPAQSLSSTIARAGRQPVWRYLYKGDFPNLRIFPQSGAYHTSEIPSVFGTYTLQNPRGPATPAQIKLSAVMQRIWAGFVRDPSAGPGWPRLQSTWDGRELGVFGGPERPDGVTVEPLVKTDLPCLVMDPILAAAGLAW